jgi:Abnormal spindle-like microcephaly-assoc'd, ASPM-SPD-2-Hydin
MNRANLLRLAAGLCLLIATVLADAPGASGQVNVTMNRYDQASTGANLNETQLNTSNVNSTQFGKLYSYAVDGSIYAQPLYVSGVNIPGQGTHNVLYVATMNDVVYAFDADSNTANAGILWSDDFRSPSAGVTAIPITDIVGANNLNIVGNVGIESTPVIDLTSNTIYLVARTKEVSGTTTNYVARVHALDITTGTEKFGGPTKIQGSVPGTGNGSSGGTLTFDPLIHNQRSSLALVNGSVIFAWASHEDDFAWHGWVMSYSATTLQQTAIYCFTANGTGGGSWMAGRAPVVDSGGNVYYMSGNGDWDGNQEFGDSIVKFSTAGGGLTVTDYFTPDDQAALDAADKDLGSSGPMLIPGTDLLIGGGKESLLYLTHTGNLGHEQTGNGQIPQLLPSGGSGFLTSGGPTLWNRTTGDGPTMYVWPDNSGGELTAFRFNGKTFDTTATSTSTVTSATGFGTGAALTVSANGSTPGTGIVWASMPTATAGHGTAPGFLRAFNADNVTVELWDSTINATQDNTGTWAKFVPPTVANGKVYVASFSNVVSVFGLLSTTPDFTVSATPGSQTVALGAGTTFLVNVGAIQGFSDTITLSVSGLPTGATASFNPTTLGGGTSSTLAVNTSANTPTGNSTLTITGISGSLTHAATVTLVVNAATTPTPAAQITPAGLTYTGQSVGVASAAQALTLANSGTAALAISGISASGDFSQTNNCGNSLGAGASCTISVVFKPTQGGNRTGTLAIADNAAGSPQTASLSGVGMTFSMTTSPSSGTITAGQTSKFTTVVSPVGGFSQAVSFTCGGAPANTTCTVSPSSVTPSGNGTASTTVSITTTASSFIPTVQWRIPPVFQLQIMAWLLVLGMLAIMMAQRKHRIRLTLCGATLAIIAIVAMGCAGTPSSGGNSTPPPGTTGTAEGTYTITVTATSGNITQKATYSMVVQ